MYRREFLRGSIAGATALGASVAIDPIHAWAQSAVSDAVKEPAAKLRRLAVGNRSIEVNGKAVRVFGLAQPDGTPGLSIDPGEDFNVALSNSGGEATLVHWHGLTPPWAMDGVPDNPMALLEPSEERRYIFPIGTSGTHWMHAHTLQEQNLLAAPLIVRTGEETKRDQQEIVILLHDFSFTPAADLLAKLKGSMPASGGASMEQGAADHGAMMQGHAMPGQPMPGMPMPGTGARLSGSFYHRTRASCLVSGLGISGGFAM